MFFKIVFLKNFEIFTGKHLCWNLFLRKRDSNYFIKKRPQHTCFPVNIAKFFVTGLFYKTIPVAASVEGSQHLIEVREPCTLQILTTNHIRRSESVSYTYHIFEQGMNKSRDYFRQSLKAGAVNRNYQWSVGITDQLVLASFQQELEIKVFFFSRNQP